MRLVPRLHSSSNEEITPEQRHIAATAIVVSKMLKIERRNFELYQQPLRLLVSVPGLSASDFTVPVRFMELMDPKRTMMAIEQVNFKCFSPTKCLALPPNNIQMDANYGPLPPGVRTGYYVFGDLYINCDSITSGSVYDSKKQSYSKTIKSLPTNGTNPIIVQSTDNILSNQIAFPLSDVNFLNNNNIRFLLNIDWMPLDIDPPQSAQYNTIQTIPLFNFANEIDSLGQAVTWGGYMTFQVVFYRYSGNDMADEE